ncbi:MAG: right-handed parallel beta-helix repeat-containing protein, partial [Candidatus Hydrogenedentes bacterium]|nr:right-handed parallel beta-helix repeat-containing protein [Candidatus Hydrogenedentota bacterium]
MEPHLAARSKLALLLYTLVLIATISHAESYYVSSTQGDDDNTGTTPEAAFSSLERAFSVASEDDFVHVMAGQYNPGGSLGSVDMTLQGIWVNGGYSEDWDLPPVDEIADLPEEDPRATVIRLSPGDDIHLNGGVNHLQFLQFIVDRNRTTAPIQPISNTLFLGVHNCQFFGGWRVLEVEGGLGELDVVGCRFERIGGSVFELSGLSHCDLIRNRFDQCGGQEPSEAPLWLDEVTTANVYRNSFTNAVENSIYVTSISPDPIYIDGNRFMGSGRCAVEIATSEQVYVLNNIITGCRYAGILTVFPGMNSGATNRIINNTFVGNARGILALLDNFAGRNSSYPTYNNIFSHHDLAAIELTTGPTGQSRPELRNNLFDRNAADYLVNSDSYLIEEVNAQPGNSQNFAGAPGFEVDFPVLSAQFALTRASSAIDTATTTLAPVDDYLNINARPRNNGYDVGAFEYQDFVGPLQISVSPREIRVPADAGVEHQAINLANLGGGLLDWSASECEWARLTVLEGLIPTSQTQSISLLYDQNLGPPRDCTITFTANGVLGSPQELKVRQEGVVGGEGEGEGEGEG